MKSKKQGTMRLAVAVICIAGFAVCGCAPEATVQKDAFFERWKTLEQTATGSSPVAVPRAVELKEPAVSGEGGKQETKPLTVIRLLPTTKINLKMNQVDVKSVLRSLAMAAGLNILIKNEIKGEISVNFSSVPWDQAFSSIMNAQGLTYVWDGDVIRVLSVEDSERDLKMKAQEVNAKWLEQPMSPVVVPIHYGKPKEIMENLKEFLSKDKEGKPIGSIKVDEHSNSLIISGIRDDRERLLSIIERIDKPTHQILIRANIVEATKDTARNLGVQWGGMYARPVGSGNLYVTPGGSTAAGTAPADPTGGRYTPAAGSPGLSGQGYGVNFPVSGAAMTAAGGAASLGLLFGTIGGNILEVQLQALQRDGKVNILSSPSITTLDNQMAYTETGERVPYVATTTAGGLTTQDVKFEDAVLRLEITPHVIGEKNMKMAILIKKNEVDTSRSVQGNPFIIKKETRTNLIVQDGETVVISGLTKQRLADSEAGVPGLKNIPGLSWLFKASGKSESLEEVLIFITPTILPPQRVAASRSASEKTAAEGK